MREFTDVARRLPRALIGWLLWQLRSHLPEATGARLASYGSLYAVVESLQKHNLITTLETNRDGRRPERTIYAITPDGVEEFEDWLAELLSTPTREFTSLEAGLSLMAGLPPEEVVRLLDERADALRLELRSLEAAGDFGEEMGLPEIFVVESHYRHAMLTAELAFVVDLAKRIRSSELGGTKVWRRMHELFAQGMPFEEILEDPVRHLGEEARILAGQQPRP